MLLLSGCPASIGWLAVETVPPRVASLRPEDNVVVVQVFPIQRESVIGVVMVDVMDGHSIRLGFDATAITLRTLTAMFVSPSDRLA